MYFAVIFIFILSYDAFLAFFNDGKLGFGVGTLVLTINPILLGCYTFGCHSIRHLIGGNLDCYSCNLYQDKVNHSSWKIVTFLNSLIPIKRPTVDEFTNCFISPVALQNFK